MASGLVQRRGAESTKRLATARPRDSAVFAVDPAKSDRDRSGLPTAGCGLHGSENCA